MLSAQTFYSSFSSCLSFQPLQKQGPLSNQLLASQADGDLLLAALKQYVLGHLSLHSGGIKQEAPSPWLRPFYDNGIQNPGLKKETSQSRLVKTGSSPVASAKEPLTSVDGVLALQSAVCICYGAFISSPERFIEKVVKNVGRQHVDVDNLTPQDLNQLSSLIADALQVVDQDQGLNRGLNRDRGPGLRDLEGEQSDSSLEASRAEKDKTMLQNVPTLNPNPQENTPLAQGTIAGMQYSFQRLTVFIESPVLISKGLFKLFSTDPS
ncbi:hypothetical protein GOODEAATRI_021585, partial [Goodea atripinnis]